MKIKITNIAYDPNIPAGSGGGSKGVHTLAGPRMIALGETVEVEMSEAELTSARGTGWFHFGDNPPAAPEYLNMTIAQRRAERRI